MKKIFISLLFTIILLPAFSAEKDPSLSVSLIADSLKQNAMAVVRKKDVTFEYETLQNGRLTVKEVITILKEQGKKYANFNYPGDKYELLNDFSGKIYDETGNLLSKIKKSEVKSSQWSEYLGSDDVYFYYNCAPPSYPFTIEYEYSVNFKNGILSFPVFEPQIDSDVSIEDSKFNLIVPQNTKILCKELNIAPCKKTSDKKTDSYFWSVKNLKAFEDEAYMPDLFNYVPLVYSNPQQFIYDDVPGEITNWESMGKWENSLLTGRQILSDAAVSKIKELTSKASTDREKVKILYDYLGKTTHYQNISLGIGGYLPMPASEVCKIGFGDCKGLSNYLKSMLLAIGIKSNYTVIKLDEDDKNIYENYANFYQFNHIILRVPLPNDTLWLECTNPEEPFGFIHNGIAGHQALVIDENGSKIVRLPDYPDSLNIDKNVAEITLSTDGKAVAKTTNSFYVKQYNDFSYFTKLKYSEQIDKVRGFVHVPSANVTNFSFVEDKSVLPCLSVKFDWEAPVYGNKTGIRMFIPANPLRRFDLKLKKNKRKFDIEVLDGSIDVDSITLTIPDNYEVEGLPAPIDFKSCFGSFYSKISISGNKISIYQKFSSAHGKWKADKYQELLDLFDKVNNGYNGKIILKAKQ